jgi:hypothetical protein
MENKKNYVLRDGKVFFWLWHSVANLKVELLNGEQKKITFYAMKKFFFGLGTLLPQPEIRTSQWREKKLRSIGWKSCFFPWHSVATT